MREGRWHQATKEKTSYEIERYLVEQFGDLSIEQVTQFELQIHLNRLAKEFSDSIVRTLSLISSPFFEPPAR